MAAMALALNVRLSKPGVYKLHGSAPSPSPLDTHRAVRRGDYVVIALVPLLAALQLIVVVACTA